jgi:orotidine-5'-phosphate decarboxylase
MPEHFADRLFAAQQAASSRIVVGLDPVWDSLPEPLRAAAATRAYGGSTAGRESACWAFREFCEGIVGATAGAACAFKPQVAFFERYGSAGLAVLEDLLLAHRDKVFICDAKRGDIGSTSAAYAAAYFGEDAPLPCAAVTHNAFLGLDTIEPYLPYLAGGHGMFVLAKTSNPGSGDFQDLDVMKHTGEPGPVEPLYVKVARRIGLLGEQFTGQSGFSALGLVVGATYPEAARAVREAAPQALILVPGLGFQGGNPQAADAFCDEQGHGAVFNFSRGVIFAWKHGPEPGRFSEAQWQDAAAHAAAHYRGVLNGVLGEL